MDKWTLQEQAFKRGYEKGKVDACIALKEELEFTREFIHEHGLDFALASAWNRRAEDA